MIELSFVNRHGVKADNTKFLNKEVLKEASIEKLPEVELVNEMIEEKLPEDVVAEAPLIAEVQDAEVEVENVILDSVSEVEVSSGSETKKKKSKKNLGE